jgi:hypothetical protein
MKTDDECALPLHLRSRLVPLDLYINPSRTNDDLQSERSREKISFFSPPKSSTKFISIASSPSHGRRQSFKIPIMIARNETTEEAINTDEPEISQLVVKLDCAIAGNE